VVIGAWFSIEVTDGHGSARLWAEAHGDALVKAGLGEGALDWSWEHLPWGSVLELEFLDEDDFERFRDLASVEAALEAAPGRVFVDRGRGGSAGTRWPRRNHPFAGAGAVALPLPDDEQDLLAAIAQAELALLAPAGASLAPAGAALAR
jgi:hypothetical protein